MSKIVNELIKEQILDLLYEFHRLIVVGDFKELYAKVSKAIDEIEKIQE